MNKYGVEILRSDYSVGMDVFLEYLENKRDDLISRGVNYNPTIDDDINNYSSALTGLFHENIDIRNQFKEEIELIHLNNQALFYKAIEYNKR